MLILLQQGNLLLRFLLELCVLAALGYWGFSLQASSLVKILCGTGAPLLIALLWGLFGSPQAQVPLSGGWHLLLEVLVFGSGVAALFAAGRTGMASALAVVLAANRLLMHLWGQ